MSIRRRPCERYRASLTDFVIRRELYPETDAALDHLDRCGSCRHELSLIALSIVGLRRLQRELEGLEPAEDAWPRLRARISRRRDPWRWRLTLGGLATSMALAVLSVLPNPISRGSSTAFDPLSSNPGRIEVRAESAYIARNRALRITPAAIGSLPIVLPHEMLVVRKEVDSAKPSVRPTAPI
jgi:hypothetical protein